jgi:hypothetical protein
VAGQQPNTNPSGRSLAPPSRPRGRWLLARSAWIVLSLLAVGFFVVSVPLYSAELRDVCAAGAQACSSKNLLTPENVRQLRGLGLPVGFYAAYNATPNAVFAGLSAVVGALIFLRRSEDKMALLVSLFLVVFGSATFADPRTRWRQPIPDCGCRSKGCSFLVRLLQRSSSTLSQAVTSCHAGPAGWLSPASPAGRRYTSSQTRCVIRSLLGRFSRAVTSRA